MRKFEEPLNLLILTGLICQGLFNETYFVVVSFVSGWFLCIIFRQQKQFIPKTLEFLILLASLLLSLQFAGAGIFLKCFSLGNGLTSLQLMRMLWPIDIRSKYFSTAIALTQIAVGSQVLLGYSFIIAIAAVFLFLPKVLYSLHMEEEKHPFDLFSRSGYWLFNHKIHYLSIAVIAILFFLFFPRIRLFNTLNIYGFGKSSENIEPTLTTSFGGESGDQKLIFRISGENISYLKLFTLDTFDGNVWSQSQSSFRAHSIFTEKTKLNDPNYRKVEIADNSYSSKFLPSDGYLLKAKGNFFLSSFFSEQGNIMISEMPKLNNKYYEYFSIIPEPYFKLLQIDKIRYTRYPEISVEIKSFVDNILGDEKIPEKQAYKLESYLRFNFTYELGSPELDSRKPIDDFIFNRKRGHCARFASALALFLRIKGIPARVVIGFYSNEKNEFGDFYNIRNSHTHAWVEAFFSDKGWKILDSTPPDMRGGSTLANLPLLTVLNDLIEYIWFSKIVNFTASDQNLFFGAIIETIRNTSHRFKANYIGIALAIIICILLMVIFVHKLKKLSLHFAVREKKIKESIRYAENFYGKMLKILAKYKYVRQSCMTPFEFVDSLKINRFPQIDSIEKLTTYFCLAKYGEVSLGKEQKIDIHKTLESLKNGKPESSRFK
ncbi:MAG TPA: hypothetical protein DD381_05760 [Lentisphaeria bacterium]|nr:MAG: hypothetical protein A2X47_08350 [Lentisphaerae bacterium GWF2_38_69]HBM15831.1 hypothetical protein [Lentisphaeria bacterium]